MEPALRVDHASGCIGFVQVSHHHLRTLEAQLSLLTRWQGPACRHVNHLQAVYVFYSGGFIPLNNMSVLMFAALRPSNIKGHIKMGTKL